MKVFDENKEDDLTELSHRLNDIRAEMEYPLINHKNNLVHIIKKGFVGELGGPLLEFLCAGPVCICLFTVEPCYYVVGEIYAEEL